MEFLFEIHFFMIITQCFSGVNNNIYTQKTVILIM